ncbi:cysteine-rich venom protein [Elysia marginata]|uniref:Cysteine-rich venom protein n=1 Tax=Elysia marginata TaxID=1093978 RepID=A0AAV4HWU0_9GAST|nr:cysteine-rich venom protein [Elysia marginata]
MKMLGTVTMLLLPLLVLLQTAEARVVDIRSEAYFIVSKHNQARRSREVRASNMLEMRWDEDLARRASSYAERCEYRRPREDRINANLYFTSDHVYGNRTIHKWLDSAINAWRRVRERYTYDRHCGRACAYVQMIMARTDRVGCALSLCENVQAGNFVVDYASLFVCYYYPGENLLNSYPYINGRECSRCDRRMQCREGLCHQPGTEIVPPELMPRNSRRGPQPIVEYRDKLTQDETRALVDSHNRMRRGNSVTRDLRWDPFLARWAQWIVHCTVDYPGPRHTFTNFERLEQGANVYDVVSKWSGEGFNMNLRMGHGCRTPVDGQSKCNHFTNLLGRELTSMACAARNCENIGDGGRQLVCLYDNHVDRPARRRTTSRRRQPYDPQRYTAQIKARRYNSRDERRNYDRRTETRRQDPRRYESRADTSRRYNPRTNSRQRYDPRTDTRQRYAPKTDQRQRPDYRTDPGRYNRRQDERI